MYLGIEIGGTKLQAGVGAGDGKLTSLDRVKAVPQAGREGICEQLRGLVQEVFARHNLKPQDLAGVGIGFGGPVDSRRGVVLTSHQVVGWDNFDLIGWFRDAFGIEPALGNDSDLAGLAEAHFGAGRGFSPVAYMNIGSGIGGALVIDGKLFAGQGLGAAEIGHLRIVPSENGKAWATVESVCSGWGMQAAARRAVEAKSPTMLDELCHGDPDQLTTEHLVLAVRAGDAVAHRIWQLAIERLGVAIANVMTLFNPARMVLGGGVAGVGDLLFVPLRREIAKQQFAPFAETWELVPAELAEEVVVHGAIQLAASR